MAVYTKKADNNWKKAFSEFEKLTGFEIMFQDEIDSGVKNCNEVWIENISWLEDLVSEASRIKTPDCFKTDKPG